MNIAPTKNMSFKGEIVVSNGSGDAGKVLRSIIPTDIVSDRSECQSLSENIDSFKASGALDKSFKSNDRLVLKRLCHVELKDNDQTMVIGFGERNWCFGLDIEKTIRLKDFYGKDATPFTDLVKKIRETIAEIREKD
jgi:hypothetical protein